MPRLRLCVAALTMISTLCAGCGLRSAPTPVATTGGWQLTRTRSGLLADDSLTAVTPVRVLRDSYELGGDSDPALAFVQPTRHGLDVGVRQHPGNVFKGWFAVTLDAFPASSVFHVHMTLPPGNVTGPGRVGEGVFAVQTASTKVTGAVNFVEVSDITAGGQSAWQVNYSHGYLTASTVAYWRSAATTRARRGADITLRTDGHRRLTVWLDSRQVCCRQDLAMQIEPPFQAYLEVQSQRVAYTPRFTGFWVTRDDTLTVTGLPPGTPVTLHTRSASTPVASAVSSANGTAPLVLPPPSAHGRGYLRFTPPGERPVMLGPFAYSGGDHYTTTNSGSYQSSEGPS